MDTKPLEHEALDLITSLLSRYNKRCVKMSFDEDGADFYIVKKEESESSLILKCLKGQSKGRNTTNRGEDVVIPKKYVTDNFLAFVYVKKEDTDEAQTYMYSAEDIRNAWEHKEDNYRLYLPKDFNLKEQNQKYLFNKKRSETIDLLLDKVGVERNEVDVNNLSDAEFFFTMWQKTGGLPSIEYIRSIFSVDDMQDVGIRFYIFLLCASVIKNDSSDFSLSIDWAFSWLKAISIDSEELVLKDNGQIFYSDVAITYSRTWVKEILSMENEVDGFHLHIGDSEESIDAYVMKNGEYGVVYNQEI